MLQRTLGSSNKSGNGTKWYEQDEIIDCKEEWQKKLANTFVNSGLAIEIKTIEPTETKTKAKPRKKKAVKK